ncbi:MAG TPA: hypothetical protein PLO37_02965 [Candidatus Hydrogenedentes bacterium]|nr:hypothetical protein [Candidatus Hydrogenedentota bacterium]HPG65781.1 hypothetical protein [Candidatus Hydrogenedentota bacterium]
MSEPGVQIGVVQSVNPARREVRIQPGRAGLRPFGGIEWIHFDVGGDGLVRCKVASEKVEGSRALMVLCAGVPRDTVARLKGARVYVPEASFRAPTSEDHELAELEGLAVHGPDGSAIGRIVAVYKTAAHGILDIEDASGRTVLLPMVESVVTGIDFERGGVSVNDIAPFLMEDGCAMEHPDTGRIGARDED